MSGMVPFSAASLLQDVVAKSLTEDAHELELKSRAVDVVTAKVMQIVGDTTDTMEDKSLARLVTMKSNGFSDESIAAAAARNEATMLLMQKLMGKMVR